MASRGVAESEVATAATGAPGAVMAVESSKILTLRCSSIRPFENQPRTDFDPHRLEELAASLAEHGQQVAIIVRKLPTVQDGVAYEIIDGERRWRAAALAGLASVRAEVRGARDYNHQFVQSVVSNFGREDHTPLDSAMAVARVFALPEYAAMPVTRRYERVGALFARSGIWVQTQLKIMTLPEGVISLVGGPKGKRLNSQLALFIGTIGDPTEQVRVARYIVDREIHPAKARLLISASRAKFGRSENASRTSEKPSSESRNVISRIVQLSRNAELLLDMPSKGVRAALGNAPGTAKQLSKAIDDAIAALEQLRGVLR